MLHSLDCRRLQAPIGGLLATLVPRAKIVPAVPLENISNDPEVVTTLPPNHISHCLSSVRELASCALMIRDTCQSLPYLHTFAANICLCEEGLSFAECNCASTCELLTSMIGYNAKIGGALPAGRPEFCWGCAGAHSQRDPEGLPGRAAQGTPPEASNPGHPWHR